ncbi:nucleotidyl transferase AbiEii/AbiGii toxin family protein [Xanthocytophaga flava]|uniref:nucleotidyl transferase AbiEii/AbiGii toxin family protein n=1 Tax=Xanthocytophaga flava TaxID=3048013 RepID=UPI0028D151E8|nr:nucleotidyl transferase AbiEii/AbiGii toxin family protein [Xanthocytophaga flavus]MDJ1470354.1 nucleotidyl transferase AbiEii/AbiGii toxin family protein [Xanthocytophaga flavus]
MHLHENNELFENAIVYTAQQKKLSELYIEKDYWVTLALYTLFTSEIGNQIVFKGGTALSKCFQLIERFSEDIDLSVLRQEGESDNQLKAKNKKVTECVSGVLPEIEIEGITTKMGKNRKTAHQYIKGFSGSMGQVRSTIIVESTWLGNFEPNTSATVNCYIAEMMLANGQKQLVEQYQLQSFPVKVLSKERTLCEKIMSLVRFSFTNDPITDLSNKIRHAYDIHMMLKDQALRSFFADSAFEDMLHRVGSDDVLSYRNNNNWLSNHPATAVIFSQTDSIWPQIRNTYHTTFKDLVFGNLPKEEEITDSLHKVSTRLESIQWIM